MCNKGDGCKYAHDMLGMDLTRADFDFTVDTLHDLNVEQVCRVLGLCIDFVKVMMASFGVMVELI